MPAIAITDGLGKRTRVELERAQRFSRSTPGNRFVTMFLVELDRTTHRTLNVNAGLSPLPRVVRSSGELITIPAGAPPLGVFADREYPFYEIELKPGDMLFSCSDGVTGAIDRLGRPVGEDRLAETSGEKSRNNDINSIDTPRITVT